MTAVMVLQDESSHWYVIPNDLHERWIELNNLMDSDGQHIFEAAVKMFMDEFNQYRVGGSPNNKQLYIE